MAKLPKFYPEVLPDPATYSEEYVVQLEFLNATVHHIDNLKPIIHTVETDVLYKTHLLQRWCRRFGWLEWKFVAIHWNSAQRDHVLNHYEIPQGSNLGGFIEREIQDLQEPLEDGIGFHHADYLGVPVIIICEAIPKEYRVWGWREAPAPCRS